MSKCQNVPSSKLQLGHIFCLFLLLRTLPQILLFLLILSTPKSERQTERTPTPNEVYGVCQPHAINQSGENPFLSSLGDGRQKWREISVDDGGGGGGRVVCLRFGRDVVGGWFIYGRGVVEVGSRYCWNLVQLSSRCGRGVGKVCSSCDRREVEIKS